MAEILEDSSFAFSIYFANDVDEMLDLSINYTLVLCTNFSGSDGVTSLWLRVPRDNYPDNASDIRASNNLGAVSYLRIFVRENTEGDVNPTPVEGAVNYIELELPAAAGYLRYSYAAGAVIPTLATGDGTNSYPFIEFQKPDNTYIRWTATAGGTIDVTTGDGSGDTFESITFNRGNSTADQFRISYGNDNQIILEDL